MTHVTEYTLSRSFHRRMTYEAKGISWKPSPGDKSPETLSSYHCDFEGCSVRFDLMHGYFTVIKNR